MISSGAAGLTQVGIERGHPALGRLAARLASADVARWPSCGAGSHVVALATCHRLELYVEEATPRAAIEGFRTWLGESGNSPAPIVREGLDAARHLLAVSAGLESAVIGEDQILTQVRAAYREACARGCAGPLLHRLFHAAFRAGRRVRSETALAAGTRSLAGAAVAALQQRTGGLRGRQVAVFGAGETAALAARLAAGRGVARILVASRTPSHGTALADGVGGEAVPWAWRERLLGQVDALICAVRADRPVVTAAALQVAAAGRAARLIVADLGMPPNVEATPVDGVEVIDLAALTARHHRDGERRQSAVAAADAIVTEELETWSAWSRWRVERRQAG